MTRLQIVGCVLAGLSATGCGASSPAAPTSQSTASSVASVWVGTIDVTGCSGDLDTCRRGSESFILRLAGDNSGWLQIDTSGAGYGEWSVPVSSMSVAGFTILRGTGVGGIGTVTSTLDVSISMRQGDVETATVQYTLSTQRNAWQERRTAVSTGRVKSARRDTSGSGGRFQGDWRGVATRISCSGDCDIDPILGAWSSRFSVSQSGASVTVDGPASFVGTATGESLTGTGHSEGPCVIHSYNGITCTVIDTTVSLTVDAFDQWHGTITYHLRGIDTENSVDHPVDITATGTLNGIGRWVY